jgi:hypothetical protein
MSPMRRSGDGGRQIGPDWESLVDRQIREAAEAGAFDDLPFQGERLPIEDDSLAGEWAMAHRMLRNAGIAPPWIESDKEARVLLEQLEAIVRRAPTVSAASRRRLVEQHDRLVRDANRAIARVNSEAPTDRQHRRPLDPVVERDRLERAFGPD